MNSCIKVCDLLLLSLHVLTAVLLNLVHPCHARLVLQDDVVPPTPPTIEFLQTAHGIADPNIIIEQVNVNGSVHEQRVYIYPKHFHAHNETLIAAARAQAGDHGGATITTASTTKYLLSRILGFPTPTFPDFPLSNPDGCNWDTDTVSNLEVHEGRVWDGIMELSGIEVVEFMAVDSCVAHREVLYRHRYYDISTEEWIPRPAKLPDHNIDHLLDQTNSEPEYRSIKVFVLIRVVGLEMLAEGVYYPETGTMHLLGCTRQKDYRRLSSEFTTFGFERDQYIILPGAPDVGEELPATRTFVPVGEYYNFTDAPPTDVSDVWIPYNYTLGFDPLNLTSNSEVCAIAVTLQYPPLNARWNSQRILKFSLRSTRDSDDPLYFDPLERTTFFPYYRRRGMDDLAMQRRLETWVRMILLILGIICVAIQIEHGRKNEESLPFVSLAMLGIQIANHVAQTSVFKDLQIGHFQLDFNQATTMMMPQGDVPIYYNISLQNGSSSMFSFLDSLADTEYYGKMAWHEYVPYQAMAMAAIFMYVWIFHRVGDRRRIMELRVRKRRLGAKDPPNDAEVMLTTLVIFYLVGFLGFCETFYRKGDDNYVYTEPYNEEYLSPKLYDLSSAQWGVVNKVTGLVVSLFLVPQLLGNWRWEFQGRPLSMCFYVGLPFLQSLPHMFTFARHFELLPIFACYDPYLDSMYGFYENPSPWWPIGVVSCSAVLVLAVHLQFR